MAHRSKVPKFGNWESGANDVPYTVYFDKARKERTGGGKMINPNDPEDNPDLFSSESGIGASAPSQIPPPSPPRSRPEADDQFKGSPARGHDNFGNRPGHGGGRRVSGGSEYSIEKSPLHQQAGGGRAASSDQYSVDRSPLHHQAKRGNNVTGSPSYESVKNSRDNNSNAHGTPGRSRLGGGASRGGDEVDKGSTLPKFGEWDENNPASADGYTHIFNKVLEEKHGAQTNPPTGSPYRGAATAKKAQNDASTSCCFPWSRK